MQLSTRFSLALIVCVAALSVFVNRAAAQTESVESAQQRSAATYQRGLELARAEQWGEALGAFQQAARELDAPIIQYNIGYCQRALAEYVAAWHTFRRVDASALPAGYPENLKAYLQDLEQVIVKIDVQLVPATAALSLDGRPLVRDGKSAMFLAGVAAPGDARSFGISRFTLVLDPGSHLVRAVRKGHEPAVVPVSYRAGERDRLDLRLALLPARVSVGSSPRAAIVRLDGREIGVSPVRFERPAGRYRVDVNLDGYEAYSANLALAAGQQADLTAELVRYEPPLTKKWWFWAAIGGVVITGAVVTYALTRPEPDPPPYKTGNTGWFVPAAF